MAVISYGMSYTKSGKDNFFSEVSSIGCEWMDWRKLESMDKVLWEVCGSLVVLVVAG